IECIRNKKVTDSQSYTLHNKKKTTKKIIGTEKINPDKIIIPKSAPNIPATPTGPGVGGTAWCVAARPIPSAIPNVTTDLHVRLDKAFTKGFKMTKAESKKIGIDTM